jgi:deazaflavin-dependent oxidoreductase (nitroreductase family)
MRAEIVRALAQPNLVDITTTGRRTGRPHRVEIMFFNFDGRIYLSGMPGRRDWYANLLADKRLTFHLKRGLRADLAAVARPIEEPGERRRVFLRIAQIWRYDVERMIRASPLVELMFREEDQAASA